MSDIDEVKYEVRKIKDLENWEDNPRTITDQEYERLQEQIRRLGVYKPLLINQQNIVLGGNMRLRALKDLGIEEVMCSIVLTDNRAQMIEYALSDNDQAGVTDVEKVQELVTLEDGVKSELFAIHSKPMTLVSKLKESAGPSAERPVSDCLHCPDHCPTSEGA